MERYLVKRTCTSTGTNPLIPEGTVNVYCKGAAGATHVVTGGPFADPDHLADFAMRYGYTSPTQAKPLLQKLQQADKTMMEYPGYWSIVSEIVAINI